MAKYYSQTQASWTGVQVGTICMMPKDENGDYYAPAGWQECNGRSLNPNEFYALYQIIGTTYGGDAAGSTYGQFTGTFKVPDLRDRKAVGTGRIRPEDASSAQLEGHLGGPSGYGTDVCGTYGGKNVMRISDVASRVQVIGNPSVSLNPTSPTLNTNLVGNSYLEVASGSISSHTAQNYPSHTHDPGFTVITTGGTGASVTLDRTSPGEGDTGVNSNSNIHSTSNWQDLAQATAGHRSFTKQPHSHWISWDSSIWQTTSYHRSYGDSVGRVGANSHLDAPDRGGVSEWRSKFVNGDINNTGQCGENTGVCTIQARADGAYLSLSTGTQTANASQVNFTLGVTVGLNSDPTIQPTYQETAYMIFLGVSADAYTAPAPPADTGDNVPGDFGPLDVTTSTASGTASASFQITDCDAVYSFTIVVDKTGGSDVGSTPINLQGTGTATNSGYVVGDTVNMVLEGPAVGGATTNYRIRIYDGADLVKTGYANVTYAVAPDVTISALPTIVTPGNSTNITFSAPGATTLVSSNFGATVATGETVTVTPSADTTYSVTVSNAYGSSTATVDVTLNVGSAPTISLTATPSTVDYGGTTRIQYVSPDATAFVSSNIPGVGSANITEGIYDVPAGTLTTDTTYNVTLSNSNGSTTEEVTVTVNPLALPTVTITSDVTAINIGADPGATIEATITGADSIVYSSSPAFTSWNNQTSLTNANISVSPDQTTTFTIAATNAAGTTTEDIEISVTQAPTIVLSANPAVLEIGTGASNPVSSSTLTWTSTDATTVVSSNFGASTVSGTTTVSPTDTTTYEIEVSGPAQPNADASVIVTVNCTTGTGTTAAGYGDTFYGYLLYNDGTKNALNNGNNLYFVQSTNSSYANTTAVGTFTYGQIGTQIIGSYEVILSRRPDSTAFDGWMNDFINNFGTTYNNLTDLNTAIYNDANGIGVGTSNEIALRAPYGGLAGNYTECDLLIV